MKIKKSHHTKKQFNYSLNSVYLAFQLRNDKTDEIKDFIDLLDIAKKELLEEVKSIEKSEKISRAGGGGKE